MKLLTGIMVATIVVCLPMAMPSPVWAALGQPAASIERDRVLMKGQQRQNNAGPGYSILAFTVAGMQIKEFVSSDGVVFAVAWQGTGVPDLQVLLGEYFEEYRDAVITERNRTPRIRKPLRLKTSRLVVERGGHSRSLWGRAFLPAALPAGLRAEDIQ